MDAITSERLRTLGKALPLFRVICLLAGLALVAYALAIVARFVYSFETETADHFFVLRAAVVLVSGIGLTWSAILAWGGRKRLWKTPHPVFFSLVFPGATLLAALVFCGASFLFVPYHLANSETYRVVRDGSIVRAGVVYRGFDEPKSAPLPLNHLVEVPLYGAAITAEVVLRDGEPLESLVASLVLKGSLSGFEENLDGALIYTTTRLVLEELRHHPSQEPVSFNPENEYLERITLISD